MRYFAPRSSQIQKIDFIRSHPELLQLEDKELIKALKKAGLLSYSTYWLDAHPERLREYALRPKEEIPMKNEEIPILYYIQDKRGYVGNSVKWWAIGGHGYTTNLDKAWRVSKEEADRIVRNRPDVDKSWPCYEIDRRATRQFDMQLFREIKGV